jgi:hypothetical protein
MKTAITKLIEDLELLKTQTFLVAPETVIEMTKKYLQVERKQIQSAYDSKCHPSQNVDGSQYYFMTFITND